MAKRRVAAIVKIQLPAGKATPAPPVGTALGPHGVQTMEFCKQYNAATEAMSGTVIPVEITIYEDRTFTFILKTPPTPVLLRQAAGIEKGANTAGREQVGTITDAQLTEIAQTKMPDLNANDLEAARRQVAGTARSMGIKVGG
jgi:large subunit ribosomal protein L11